jgi:hypothetical protein
MREERPRVWPEIPAEVLEGDRELGPALWLLSAPGLAERTGPHVDLRRRRVDWEGLRGEPWSSGERELVELARALWRGAGEVHPGAWGARLDADHLGRVLEAIAMAGGLRALVWGPRRLPAGRCPGCGRPGLGRGGGETQRLGLGSDRAREAER